MSTVYELIIKHQFKYRSLQKSQRRIECQIKIKLFSAVMDILKLFKLISLTLQQKFDVSLKQKPLGKNQL